LVKLVVVGNSHLRSVMNAARPEGVERMVLRSNAHMEDRPDGTKVMDAETVARLRREPGPVFSVIGGNAHNVFGLVYPQKPFDFYHPDYPDRPPARHIWIVPFEQVWDSVMRRATTRLKELRALVAACPGRVVQMGSPPPIPSQKWLTDNLAERMQTAGIRTYEVASPSVRYKLWRVNSAIFREECERLGVPFVPAPREACNAEGFLLRRYWRDPTHANGHYGTLLVTQMMEHFDVAPV
jgi:hypothetical protein